MLKKVLIVLLVGFAVQVIVSCACKCADSHVCKYTFSSLTTSSIDTSGLYPIISNSDTIPKSNFGLKFQFGLIQSGTCNTGASFSFFEQAHAQHCVCPPAVVFNPQDTISSLVITTINNFDAQHPADTDVTEYFKLYGTNNSTTPIADFLKAKEYSFATIDTGENLAFFLVNAPVLSGSQSFKITVTLSNNVIISHTSKSVYLK